MGAKFSKQLLAVELDGKPYAVALSSEAMLKVLETAAAASPGGTLDLRPVPNAALFDVLLENAAPNQTDLVSTCPDCGQFRDHGHQCPAPTRPGETQYETAVKVVREANKASTSFIQRRLNIGYNAAARLIERMEAEGIVSRANHAGARSVL